MKDWIALGMMLVLVVAILAGVGIATPETALALLVLVCVGVFLGGRALVRRLRRTRKDKQLGIAAE